MALERPTAPSSASPARSSMASSSSPVSAASSPRNKSETNGGGATIDASTRCRYKTGRCANARVVKPNGSLLLLCEFHRDQQNRTKKRSDMKYRHHRAKKRQLEKHSPRLQHPLPTAHLGLGLSLRQAASQLAITITQPHVSSSSSLHPLLTAQPARPLLPGEQLLSPIVSTPTMLRASSASLAHTPGAVLMRREATSSALKKSALFKLRVSHAAGSRISPGKAHAAGARFTSRRDIVAMASPAGKAPMGLAVPLSPMVFPPNLSPLRHSSPWARAWQPEDVQLLEYFIM